MLRKQSCDTPKTTIDPKIPGKEMLLKTNHLQQGVCVSIDQYHTPIIGHLSHTYGKEKHDQQYNGSTILVDHTSGLMAAYHHVS